MNRELIERTLAAMDKGYMSHHHAEYAAVMEALKAELAKPEPEPVAWLSTDCIGERYLCFTKPTDNDPVVPLYAAPTEPNCKFPTCHSQEYQNKLVQEILGQETETAYICNGCGAIYWENNVSCDCAVPALNQFTRADVYTKGTP